MSLNKKTVLFMSAIFSVMFLILAVISFTVLLSSFERIERDKMLQNIERGENALNEKVSDFLFVEMLPRLPSGKIDRLEAAELIKKSI